MIGERVRLEPVWVEDLLGLVQSDDWRESRERLGYPTVCRTFRDYVGGDDGDGAYSSLEVQAMRDGVEWLSSHRPQHWQALRTHMTGGVTCCHAREAARLLEKFVDERCG